MEKISRRGFLKAGTVLAAASFVVPGIAQGGSLPVVRDEDIFKKFVCPQWFKDAKFGLWLHWGPQTIPSRGAGWYARHMYMSPNDPKHEKFGLDAWEYHRQTFGHQADFGYKDVCRLWKAEKFDADATVKQFKKWGARYVAIIANHHDNYDLFNSSIHDWNTIKVGPKRDILGEFAEAARRNQVKWVATAHAFQAKEWFAPAFGADDDGPRAGEPYDGNLTKEDGKCAWWNGFNPQQLYAHKYEPFEREFGQRLSELVNNYRPDMLYFDNYHIPEPAMNACSELYKNSLKENGTIQAIVTVKKEREGTILDYEKGIADGIRPEYWQTDTSLNEDWFLKTDVDKDGLRHNARTLKELFVDIISKRGVMLLNLPVNADGSIPDDQFAIMEEFGGWMQANAEAIYETEPWVIHGENGASSGGHLNERTLKSEPWNHEVVRFTRNKAGSILYIHVFGSPAGKHLTVKSPADKKLFRGSVKNISLIGSNDKIKWTLNRDGLQIDMPEKVAFKDCNVLKVTIK